VEFIAASHRHGDLLLVIATASGKLPCDPFPAPLEQ
jgi:hypothetical protein